MKQLVPNYSEVGTISSPEKKRKRKKSLRFFISNTKQLAKRIICHHLIMQLDSPLSFFSGEKKSFCSLTEISFTNKRSSWDHQNSPSLSLFMNPPTHKHTSKPSFLLLKLLCLPLSLLPILSYNHILNTTHTKRQSLS